MTAPALAVGALASAMAGQIHDETSEVASFRLEGTSLYVASYEVRPPARRLGDRVEGKFVAHDGKVDIALYGVTAKHS